MRGAIIFCLLALALGGAFYFFVMRGGPEFSAAELAPPVTTRKVVPTTIPSLDSQVPVGRSAGVWIESIDAKTGRKVNEFRSEDVVPRADGSVDVMNPQARFYGNKGGIITLDGSEGHILYTQAGARDDARALGTSTPTSGELRDVTVRYYERSLDDEPMIVVSVPAVRFDSNSNRISTIDCVVDGQGYAAEQVPVTMRGRDFDFDGQGLTLAWNDREGMLDQLEILRGNRLVVRDVSKFIGEDVARAEPRHPGYRPTLTQAVLGLVMLQAPEKKTEELYLATFDRDVRVIKDGREVATADVMRCVIPLGKPGHDEPSGPATKSARPKRENADRARPRDDKEPAPAPTTQAVPMEIRWTGKLTVRPARIVTDMLETAMVEFVGNPARVEENGASASGRLIRVEPDAGRVRIEPGGNVRAIELKDATGAELRSRSPLVIDETEGLATIDGGGALNVPASESQQSPLALSWSKKLSVVLGKGAHAGLQGVLIEGEAKVDSDRLAMNCESLELSFDAAAEPVEKKDAQSRFAMPSPDLALLRRVHARGDAVCRVGTAEAQRTLAAQDIQLGFVGSEKDALLDSMLCDGQVSLVDSSGLNLDAGTLSVQTVPMSLTDSKGELDGDFFSLLKGFNAQKAVRIKRADGSMLEGDEVELSGAGEQQRLTVSGAPARLASPKGSLNGDHIELDPATGDIRVPGTGNFAGTNPDQPGAEVAISWAESMNVVGATGECRFAGGVNISGGDSKGSRLFATADHGSMQFKKKDASATQPAAAGLQSIEFEAIRTLTLDGNVDLNVKAADKRTSSMESERLEVDLESGTMSLPQQGRMQLIDGRKGSATTRSAIGPGALAMQWNDRLDWDMRAGQLKLSGDVRVGFEREGSDDPVRILCDRLTGSLTPIETSNGFDQLTPRIDLKTLSAHGNVAVRSKDASFDATELLYDLQTQLAVARGTDTRPVEVLDTTGISRIGFSSITWNLETGLIEDFRDITGQIRR